MITECPETEVATSDDDGVPDTRPRVPGAPTAVSASVGAEEKEPGAVAQPATSGTVAAQKRQQPRNPTRMGAIDKALVSARSL